MSDLDATLDPVPDVVRELERGCREYVKRALGIELDGTADTLPLLDHYLASVEAIDKDEVMELVTRAAGAYFGEVIRRTFGQARWHVEPADPSAWRLEFERVFLFFNPLGVAREAILREEQAGWRAHLEVLTRDRALLEASLSNVGGVREDDYYRLAVRFEVIDQVLAALDAASASRRGEEEHFGPAAYAEAEAALRGEGDASD